MSLYTDLDDWYRPIPRLGKYVTAKHVVWAIGKKNSGLAYVVPPDFPFDVSVPWWVPVWAVDPCDRRFMKAACLHDHMIEAGWDRPTAGAVFNDALKADGVSPAKRLLMFTAVVWFKWA